MTTTPLICILSKIFDNVSFTLLKLNSCIAKKKQRLIFKAENCQTFPTNAKFEEIDPANDETAMLVFDPDSFLYNRGSSTDF